MLGHIKSPGSFQQRQREGEGTQRMVEAAVLIAACQIRVHRAAVKTYHSEVPMNDVFAANRQTSKT